MAKAVWNRFGPISKNGISAATTAERNAHMKKYVCTVCGYVYDPEAGDPDQGIAPGTGWEDVPEEYVCPTCGVGKDLFEEE